MPPDDPDDMADVIDLNRIRVIRDFEDDEKVAYIEALWGTKTFAMSVAIRDLEAMRRGTESPEKPLREPETTYEAELMVKHLRWLANHMARGWSLEYLVRDEDWQGDESLKPEDDT